MALLVFHTQVGSVAQAQDDAGAEYPAANTQPQEIPTWSCKAPNSWDSKDQRDLGSCVSHFGKPFPP